MPSQSAVTARSTASKNRATGPRPLRTARGAGRLPVLFFADDERLLDPLLPVLLAAGRVARAGVARVLVLVVLRDLVPEPLEDVLVLRDPGGEDVRVAMVATLGDRHTRHMD
ncbi:hypothetical protein [Nocardioides acrostichi]|uniref:hypothetical protein n=1 Tax=Nocardioides acrostichi TaxID=2784339 RepID=UPI001F37242C|nr:hypothetical protein [Nocardioides acrostichi]